MRSNWNQVVFRRRLSEYSTWGRGTKETLKLISGSLLLYIWVLEWQIIALSQSRIFIGLLPNGNIFSSLDVLEVLLIARSRGHTSCRYPTIIKFVRLTPSFPCVHGKEHRSRRPHALTIVPGAEPLQCACVVPYASAWRVGTAGQRS